MSETLSYTPHSEAEVSLSNPLAEMPESRQEFVEVQVAAPLNGLDQWVTTRSDQELDDYFSTLSAAGISAEMIPVK